MTLFEGICDGIAGILHAFGIHYSLSHEAVLALPMAAVSSRMRFLTRMLKKSSGKSGAGSDGVDAVNEEFGSPAEREAEYARLAEEGRAREASEKR